MSQAYRWIKSKCGICKNRHDCYGWRKIELGEAMEYGMLEAMAGCYRRDPENTKKEGDQ